MAQGIPENKMGVMPVNRLLLSMSAPMMIAMLVQALYNVVDSIFVSWINQDALTAVSLAFPVQNIMIALAVGTGVGVNALLSKSLGEKDYDRANRTAANGIFLIAVTCIAFMVLGTALVRPFFTVQTPIKAIVEYGVEYLSVVTLFSAGVFTEIIFERLLQSTGRTLFTMFTQGVGAVFNIIFDPILIFGWGPFPEMGVRGAAVATVLGQFIAAGLAIFFNQTRNPEISLSFRGFKPDGWIIRHIYAVGAPSIIMNAISSVMVFAMNQILLGFTKTAATVMGVYGKVQSFIFMPVFGLNNGMVPIIAYNYGARNKERLLKTVKLAILYAVAIMMVGLAVMQLLPERILLIFKADKAMLEIGVPALRTISLSFLFAGYCIVVSSVLQALGWGVRSMLTSIVRQLVVLLPAAWLFSLTGNVNMVWWAYPVAELASLALCTVFFIDAYRKIIKPLGEPRVE